MQKYVGLNNKNHQYLASVEHFLREKFLSKRSWTVFIAYCMHVISVDFWVSEIENVKIIFIFGYILEINE